MIKMYNMKLTKAGYQKIQEAIESVETLELSKFIFAHNDNDIDENMTDLENIVYENYITHRENISEKEVILQSVIPLWDGGFTINKLGIIDTVGDLICVGNIPLTYVPNIEEGATKEIDIKVVINIKSAENIEITVDPTITLVTKEKLEQSLEEVLELIDNKVEYSELDDAIEQLIGEAPEALDTLYELAEALDNDPNFATTVTKELSNKVDKEEGKGLSANDFTDEHKLKLETLKQIEKVSELKQDIPYLLEKDIENKVNKEDLQSTKNELIEMIENIDIPEVDLTYIEKELQRLEEEKANKSDVKNALENIIEVIESYLTEQLEVINKVIDGKADQSEIDRLELMIKDIVEGEDRKYVIPRITSSPILNEVYYQSKPLDKPVVAWFGDDWGSWNVEDIEHLKLDSHGSYSGAECRVRTGDGVMIMDFVKEDPNRPYSIKQTRNGKVILDTGYIKENKKHKLYIKAGDRINVLAAFKGDVYITYEGYQSDLRLSAYKNGKVEEIANKRLVEERLEDFTLKDEFESKIGKLELLTTEEKDNIVDSINYLMNTKADDDDLKDVLEALKIVTEDIINKVLALDVDKADKTYVDDKLSDKADKDKVVTSVNGQVGKVEIDLHDSVNFDKDIREDTPIRDFQNGISISAVPNTAYFPSIGKFGVVITFVNKNYGGYGQLFITSDGDLWSRRTNSLSTWGNWYSIKSEINNKADTDHKHIDYEKDIQNIIEQIESLDIPDDVDLSPIYDELNTKADKNKVVTSVNEKTGDIMLTGDNIKYNKWSTLNEELNLKANTWDLLDKADKEIKDKNNSNRYELIVKNGVPYLEIVE